MASIYSVTTQAEALLLGSRSIQVMDKMNKLAELATHSENITQICDEKYIEYKDKSLFINFDGNIQFGTTDFHSEFSTVFDFRPTEWGNITMRVDFIFTLVNRMAVNLNDFQQRRDLNTVKEITFGKHL